MPQVTESISSPASHDWRPRAIDRLGVHRGAFAQQKLCRRDVAVACCLVQRRPTSRLFLRGPSAAAAEAAGDDERCGQRSSITRSTDKRTMNVSGLNVFKTVQSRKCQKNIHKQSQTHRTSFNTSCFRQITFNETIFLWFNSLFSHIEKLKAIKNNVIK